MLRSLRTPEGLVQQVFGQSGPGLTKAVTLAALLCSAAAGAGFQVTRQPGRDASDSTTPEPRGQAATDADAVSDESTLEGADAESSPPVKVPPDGILPLSELTRLSFAPSDRPKPLLYGNRLLVVSESGFVEGHDAESGEFAWKLGLPGETLYDPVVFDAAPLADDEEARFNVVLSTHAGHVLVVDGPTGKIEREAWLPFELALPPARGPDTIIFLATPSGDVVGYDVEREVVVFQTATGESPNALASTDSVLMVSGASQHLTAIDLPTGDVRWVLTGRAPFHAPAAFGLGSDRVYIGDDAGELYCLDAKNGHVKFRWATGAAIRSPILVEADRIFVASFANTIYAYNAGNGHELWRANLPGRPSTGPVRIGNRIMIATFEGTVLEINPQRGQLGKSYTAPGEIVHAPTFFIEKPTAAEQEAMDALALGESRSDEVLDEVLDPEVFGPSEMISLVEPEFGVTGGADSGDDETAQGVVSVEVDTPAVEPMWFERSRIAMALRSGEVLILRHSTPASGSSAQAEESDDVPGSTRDPPRPRRPREPGEAGKPGNKGGAPPTGQPLSHFRHSLSTEKERRPWNPVPFDGTEPADLSGVRPALTLPAP